MIKLAGLAKPFLQKEAVAQPNTILVTRMDNGNTDMQFPNPTELDSDVYADALEMAEFWQTQARGSDSNEYQIYLSCADDGDGNDFTTGQPLKTYQEWLES